MTIKSPSLFHFQPNSLLERGMKRSFDTTSKPCILIESILMVCFSNDVKFFPLTFRSHTDTRKCLLFLAVPTPL